MTDANTPDSSTASDVGSEMDAIPFPSLDAMRSVHGGMLKHKQSAADSPMFLEQIQAFVCSAQATGAVLDSDRDRSSAQTLIDYWVTVLFRATRDHREETVLDEFDPALNSYELRDDQYPYADAAGSEPKAVTLLLGTHRMVAQSIRQLDETRFLAIVGPTGSGRSTLLRKGLLPALQDGETLGSAQWRFYPIIEPGAKPLLQLAELFRRPEDDEAWVTQQADLFRQDSTHLSHLIRRDGDEPAVLVVDHFGEVFNCSDNVERDAFVDNLVAASQAPSPATTCSVVLLLKPDCLARADSLPTLSALLERSIVYVSFTADEIREAIEKPAGQIGLKFDEGLVDRLILDVQGDPAALALLQFTLHKLWDHREKNRISWSAYRQVGGGRLALERAAESVYRELSDEEKAATKDVFLHLVRPDTVQDATTPSVPRGQLYAGKGTQAIVDRVVDRFAQSRLLRITPAEADEVERVAMAHAALVGHWPRLVEWLAEERDRLRRRLRLSDVVETWIRRDKDVGVFWRGSLLDEAERYTDLNESETEFVRASRRAVVEAERAELEAARELADEQEQRAEAEHLTRKRTQVAAVALAAALVVVSVLGYKTYRSFRAAEEAGKAERAAKELALVARQDADRQSVMLTVTQGTQLVQRGDRPGAALWFADAMKEKDAKKTGDPIVVSDETYDVLKRRVTANLRQQPLLNNLLYPKPAASTAYADNYLATVAAFGWRANQAVLTSSNEDDSRRDTFALSPNDQAFAHSDDTVRWAAVSPGGGLVATVDTDEEGSTIGVVRIWDAGETDEPLHKFTELPDRVEQVVFSPNGKYLAVACGKVESKADELWVFELGEDPLQEPLISGLGVGAIQSLVFGVRKAASAADAAPDTGNIWLAAACQDTGQDGQASVHIWQVPAGPQTPQVLKMENRLRINRVAFSEDGQWLITAAGTQQDETGEAQIWILAETPTEEDQTGEKTARWKFEKKLPHQGGVTAAEFSPCGHLVVTASHSGSGVLWDRSSKRWLASLRHQSSVFDACFSPDGRFVATSSRDGTARVWDVATGEAAMPPMYHVGTVSRIRFSSDCRYLLTISQGTIRAWQLATGNPQPRLYKPAGQVDRITISQDAKHLVTVGKPGVNASATCQLWGLEGNVLIPIAEVSSPDKETSPVDSPLQIKCAAISPQGDFFVTADSSGAILRREIGSSADQASVPLAKDLGVVNHLAISKDGRWLAAGTGDASDSEGAAYVWDMSTDECVFESSGSHDAGVLSVAFDASGQRLVTASADDTARVWDLATGEQIGSKLQHTADVACASFSQDREGRYIVTASFDRTAVVWDAKDGKKLATMWHDGYVTGASFGPKEGHLVTTSNDGAAYVWYLRSEPDQKSSAESALFPEIVTRLEHGEQLQQACFDATGDQVTTIGFFVPRLTSNLTVAPGPANRLIQVRRWRISPDVKSSAQADAFAQLQGARFVNENRQDIEPLKATELGEIWGANDDTYAEVFGVNSHSDNRQQLARECEDSNQWYSARWYVNKLIEAESQETEPNDAKLAELQIRRERASAELAAYDARRAIAKGDGRVLARLALARLAAKDHAGYREACSQMFARFSDGDDQYAKNLALWNLILFPTQVFKDNDSQIVEAAERLVEFARAEAEAKNAQALAVHRCLNTLGAAYYRTGEFQKAIDMLTNSEDDYQLVQIQRGRDGLVDVQRSKIWNQLILTMAYAGLGQKELAEQYLERAKEAFGQAQEQDSKQSVNALDTPLPAMLEEAAETVRATAEKTVAEA